MTVSIGLNRWDWRTPSTFVDSVRHGEAAGIDHCFLPVNPLSVWDPYVLMTAAAMATDTIRFGPLLETPMLRPPAVAAGSIASLAEISGGRAMLTYGIGDTAVRYLGRRPARLAELEEATVQAKAYLAGDRLEVGAASPAWLRHARPAPVWLACGGPKSLRMAGRVADGVFLRVGTHPANLQTAVEAVKEGAREAGRDPSEVALAAIVHTCRSQDTAEIRAISRSMAAGFYEYSPALFSQAGFEWNGTPIETLKKQLWPDFHHASDLVAAGQLVDFLSDEVAASFSFFGSAADVSAQMRALLDQVPELEILVPHPVPMPVRDELRDYVDWLSGSVLSRI